MQYPKAVTTPKFKLTSLQLSGEFLDFLTVEARMNECSKADIIREALDMWVKKYCHRDDDEKRAELMSEMVRKRIEEEKEDFLQ